MAVRACRLGPSGRDALAGLVLMMARGSVAFGCGIVYARSLGPTGRGEIALAITSAGLIGLGIHTVAVPSFVQTRLSGTWRSGQLKNQATTVALAGTVPLAAGIALLLIVSHSRVPVDAFLLLSLVLGAATSVIYVAQGVGEGREASTWGTAGAVAAGTATVALSLADRLTPRTALVAFSLVYLVPLAGLLPFRWASPRARSNARPQATSAASAVLILLLWRGDIYLVAGLLSTRALGIYAIGVSIAEISQVVLSGLRAALTPRLRPLAAADVPVALLARLNQVAVLLLAGAAVLLVLAGPPLFELVYGPDFGDAAAVALLLLPGMWGFIIVSTYLETLQISGEGRFLVSALGGALLLNVLLNLALARRFGLLVPAASSSLCYFGLGLLTVGRASRSAGIPAVRLLVPRRQTP